MTRSSTSWGRALVAPLPSPTPGPDQGDGTRSGRPTTAISRECAIFSCQLSEGARHLLFTVVHLRVGGETGHRRRRYRLRPRSIPAWAAHPRKPTERAPGPRLPSPESAQFSVARNAQFSSAIDSGRGNRPPRLGGGGRAGSIPAWAGKPGACPTSGHESRVHPRVGGETAEALLGLTLRGGPSPRGRGNPRRRLSGENDRVAQGPSPRGRGNRHMNWFHGCATGSIPAWAGKPTPDRSPSPRAEVHPRVGGETPTMANGHHDGAGPSPRGRGNPHHRPLSPLHQGSIPAWAGKPLRREPWV